MEPTREEMMSHYLFSVMHDYDNNPPIAEPVDDADMFERVGAFNESIKDKILMKGGLYAPDSATTCSVVNGEAIATDGPYTESKELIGGLWIIDAASRDEAVELGKRATQACGVPVEVRPFHEL
jgi:hypothetical protein